MRLHDPAITFHEHNAVAEVRRCRNAKVTAPNSSNSSMAGGPEKEMLGGNHREGVIRHANNEENQ